MSECKDVYYEYFYKTSPVIDIYLEGNEGIEDFILNHLDLVEHLKILLTDKENQKIKEPCILCEGKEQEKMISKDIITTSEILIININRKNEKNNIISFNYPKEFSGKKVINNDSIYDLPDYELTTVIKKDKNNNSKYHGFYKSFIDNNWYSYNNEKIELIPKSNYTSYILDSRNACLLIFTKKKN